MSKVCNSGHIVRIWGPRAGLDLIQVWSSSTMASYGCHTIVPNLVTISTPLTEQSAVSR